MAIERLWKHLGIPIFSKNLIEQQIISSSLNNEAAQAANEAFQSYLKLRNDTASSSNNNNNNTNKNRRRRTSRHNTKQLSNNNTTNNNSTGVNIQGSELTPNDFFFEHQRVQGFIHGTPILSQSSAIQTLNESLETQVEEYLRLLGGKAATMLPPLIQNGLLKLDLWAAVQQGRGAYHKDHVHEGVIVSGVYYAKVPEGSAPLVMHKPTTLYPDGSFGYSNNNNKEQNKESDDATTTTTATTTIVSCESEDEIIVMKPEEGRVILFPPWLLHGVPKVVNTGTNDGGNQMPRISFAFNLSGAYAGGDPWSVINSDSCDVS